MVTGEALLAGGERLEILRGFFAGMARHRALEEMLSEAVRARKVEGLLHLSMGAEAVTAAIISRLGDSDRVYSSHRAHGHFLAAGVPARALVAEIAGRDSGVCRGRGGSLHLMSDRAVMASGIVGGTLPPAVGHALVLEPGALVVAFFGDGAVQTGTFHEAMNLAALWKAPVLFVCENNGWAEFSSRDEHTTVGGVVRYGDLYGIAAREVDGTDVELVAGVAGELVPAIRAGGGPALVECHISRLRPHYEGDWRPPEETEGDPLAVIERRLVELGEDGEALAAARGALLQEMRDLLDDILAGDALPDPGDEAGLVFARPPGGSPAGVGESPAGAREPAGGRPGRPG